MKIKIIVVAIVLAGIITPSCKKGGSGALKTELDSMSYAYGLLMTRSFKSSGMPTMNSAAFHQAMNDVLNDKKALMEDAAADQFLRQYFMKQQTLLADETMKKGQEFLNNNKTRAGVKVTATGLQYEVVKEGTGKTPVGSDIVTCNYKGMHLDGTVFDSSYDRNQPAQFRLDQIIPGWSEALLMMKVGSKWKIYLPSELAYGPGGNRDKIKPNEALIFEVELLSIQEGKK
jgi:FKBP-type peptidyl-prolyl cis-trans isomerase